MGVPSFFRWLAERYPLSLERLHRPCGSEGEESHAGAGPIDNLYLDLNGGGPRRSRPRAPRPHSRPPPAPVQESSTRASTRSTARRPPRRTRSFSQSSPT